MAAHKAKINPLTTGIVILFLLLFLYGLYLLSNTEFDSQGTKIFLLLFVSAFTLVLVISLLQKFIQYIVQRDGILIRSLISSNIKIPYQDLKTVKWLDENEAWEIWNNFHEEEMNIRSELDLSKYFGYLGRHKKMTRYCTLQPIYSEVSTGNERNIVDHNTYILGDYVLVADNYDLTILISPQNVVGFLKDLKNHYPGIEIPENKQLY